MSDPPKGLQERGDPDHPVEADSPLVEGEPSAAPQEPDDATFTADYYRSQAPQEPEGDVEAIARQFHEVYERLAPAYDWTTQPRSSVPWDELPEQQRALMMRVVGDVESTLLAALSAEKDAHAETRERIIDDSVAVRRLWNAKVAAEAARDAALADVERLREALREHGRHW